MTEGGRINTFIQELVRRRVFRAAAAYVVVSWLLVQVASIVFPEFDFPDWSMRVLIVLLTVGFPLAMLLAFTMDITSSGFAVTADSPYSMARGNALRFGIVSVATLLSAAVLWWVWADYLQPTTMRTVRSPIRENPVIAVNSLDKLSGSEELDWLGDGVANLIRNELAESRHVIVMSPSRWEAISADAETREQLVDAAGTAGIDYLIGGEFLPSPDGIVLTSWIEDVAARQVILGTQLDAVDAAGMVGETTELAARIKRALNVPLVDTVTLYAADFAVANLAAYEAYVAGLKYLYNFDYQAAEDSYEAALALAPNFHIARFRLAHLYDVTARAELAREELDKIPTDAELTEREHLYIEGARSTLTATRDPARSIEIYRELVAKYPYELEGGLHLASSYWLDFQEDAAIAEYERLVSLHPFEPTSWMALGERLLDVGRLHDADAALGRFVEMSPDDHYGVALLGNLAQLRGDFAGSIPHYERSLVLKPGFAVATLGLARSRFLLGQVDEAETLLGQLANDDVQSSRFRIDAAFDLSGIRSGQGRFSESIRPLLDNEEMIREEALRIAVMLSTLGLAELELGNVERAAALINESIEASPGVATGYLFARGLMEIRLRDYQQLERTAAEIRTLALPPEDPDRTEEKAADYLDGIAALEQGELTTAISHLEAALTRDGFSYAAYSLGLARARFAVGELDAAARIAQETVESRDPGDLRFDLELDRARATLLYAQILAAQGDTDAASAAARAFLDRWRSAPEDAPDVVTARAILAAD